MVMTIKQKIFLFIFDNDFNLEYIPQSKSINNIDVIIRAKDKPGCIKIRDYLKGIASKFQSNVSVADKLIISIWNNPVRISFYFYNSLYDMAPREICTVYPQ
jgi:hypothetical protein